MLLIQPKADTFKSMQYLGLTESAYEWIDYRVGSRATIEQVSDLIDGMNPLQWLNYLNPATALRRLAQLQDVDARLTHYELSVVLQVRESTIANWESQGLEFSHNRTTLRDVVYYFESRQYANELTEPEPDLVEPKPTDAVPGSIEKVEILAERWRAKQAMHHELDMRGVASKMSDAGKAVDVEIVDRAIELWRNGEDVSDIADRLGVAKTTIRNWTRGIDREVEDVVEPWLLANERKFLEVYLTSNSWEYSRRLSGPFSTSRLMRKLGIESREDLLIGYQQYLDRENELSRLDALARKAAQVPKVEYSTTCLFDNAGPVEWANIDVHVLYQLASDATKWLWQDPCLRDDVKQELVMLGPSVVQSYREKWDDPSGLDGYIFRAFKKKSTTIKYRAAYRSPFAAAKRQSEARVDSYDGHVIASHVESDGIGPCLVCGTQTHLRYVCSDPCLASLHKYKKTLAESALACDRIIELTGDLKPHSATELQAAIGSDGTLMLQSIAWLKAIGYTIELTELGYIIGGLPKLQRELLWMATPNYTSPKIVSLLKMAGIRAVQQSGGWVAHGSLTTAQQIAVYRMQPWKTTCIHCDADVTPSQQESLTGRFYISMTCEKCRYSMQSLRRKGWQV